MLDRLKAALRRGGHADQSGDGVGTREEVLEREQLDRTAGQMNMPGVGSTRNASDAAFKPPR
jgi:hypothetical protein